MSVKNVIVLVQEEILFLYRNWSLIERSVQLLSPKLRLITIILEKFLILGRFAFYPSDQEKAEKRLPAHEPCLIALNSVLPQAVPCGWTYFLLSWPVHRRIELRFYSCLFLPVSPKHTLQRSSRLVPLFRKNNTQMKFCYYIACLCRLSLQAAKTRSTTFTVLIISYKII